MTQMNPDVKKQWVAALLSGQYVQMRNALASPDRDGKGRLHCCAMGVLNDISHLGRWRGGEYFVEDFLDEDDRYLDWTEYVYDHADEFPELEQFMERGWDPEDVAARYPTEEEYKALPELLRADINDRSLAEEELAHVAVAKWAGLADLDPEVKPDGSALSISIAQLNDEGYSFKQLAMLIEEQL